MIEFKHLTRRKIRYWLFVKKKGIKRDNLPCFFNALVEHYENQPHFTSWHGFAEPHTKDNGLRCYQAWDIGIDDQRTKLTRPEKAWLFNNTRFEVVQRKDISDGINAIEQQNQLTAGAIAPS